MSLLEIASRPRRSKQDISSDALANRDANLRVRALTDRPDLLPQALRSGLSLSEIQVWDIAATSQRLSYGTHGFSRYFGKFPPPIAQHLMATYSRKGAVIADPMCGSGTSTLEALLDGNDVIASDVSPLAVMLTNAKTRLGMRVADLVSAAEETIRLSRRMKAVVPDLHLSLRNPSHWFLDETVNNLGKINAAIGRVTADVPEAAPFLYASLAAIIRQASRATSQQGRLFLDVDSAVPDPREIFERRMQKNLAALQSLPRYARRPARVADARLVRFPKAVDLAIMHPPYFNAYKYSAVYSLELAWLGHAIKSIRHGELREGFKQGAKASVGDYIDDLMAAILNVSPQLAPRGKIAVMAGDTVLCGTYIPVLKLLCEGLKQRGLKPISIAMRPPRFTEASWVASQRRETLALGAQMADYVVVFELT